MNPFGFGTRRTRQEELSSIAPDDRTYVAAEMTAFLAAWLSGLKCPVINKPTTTCLTGPYWRREKWVQTASRLGIPVFPVRRYAPASNSATPDYPAVPLTAITVVNDRVLGPVDNETAKHARTLADAARVKMLCVRFTDSNEGPLFVDADYWLDFSNTEISDAILNYLQSHGEKK